jgi:hypothetical protein
VVDVREAARVLGVAPQAPWDDVRRAYRLAIAIHHPDRTGDAGDEAAVRIIEAFRVLERAHLDPQPDHSHLPPAPAPPPRPPAPPWRASVPETATLTRVDDDTLRIDAPADEAFRWLIEGAHELGDVTYLDRSGPIFEVLCRFEGEPSTSLLVTLQGRSDGTDALCSAESIEARPGPPTVLVVDAYEAALRSLLTT